MWLTLFTTAAQSLLGGNKASGAASASLAACQGSLQQSMELVTRLTRQRNAALLAIPLALAVGVMVGRKTA